VIAELGVLLVWLGSGALALRACGLRDWALAPLGLLTGLAMYFAVGAVQVATPLPDHPAIALVVAPLVAVGFVIARRRRGQSLAVNWVVPVSAIATVTAAVLVTRSWHLVKWHVDTFEYLIVGTLMTEGHLAEATNSDYVSKRLLGVPMMHAPALWWDERYMRAATPLVALACVLVVVWVVRRTLASTAAPALAWAVPALAAVALVANNRFVFHAFYLNGHMLVAAFLVALVGAVWLYLSGADVERSALLAIMMAAIAGLVVTRPEGGLLAGFALVSFFVSRVPVQRHQSMALGALGLALVLWHGYSVATHVNLAEPMSLSAVAYAALGVAAAVLAALWWRGLFFARYQWIPPALERAVWIALAIFVVRDAEIFNHSIGAAWEMVMPDSFTWGSSLALAYVAAFGLLAVTRFPHALVLRYPFTTFIPLAFVLAYVRDGRYNSYSMDSLNRMLIEMVPLLIMFVAIAGTVGVARWRDGAVWSAGGLTVVRPRGACVSVR
jgi:hypothetical protein